MLKNYIPIHVNHMKKVWTCTGFCFLSVQGSWPTRFQNSERRTNGNIYQLSFTQDLRPCVPTCTSLRFWTGSITPPHHLVLTWQEAFPKLFTAALRIKPGSFELQSKTTRRQPSVGACTWSGWALGTQHSNACPPEMAGTSHSSEHGSLG